MDAHTKKILDEYDEWMKDFDANLAATKQRLIDQQGDE